MSIWQKIFIWYRMCSKRLLRKHSFIILLLLIPLLIPITKTAMKEESGILKIAITAEDDSDAAKRAIDYMLTTDSIIRFVPCDNTKEATQLVKKHKVDSAWIFKENLESKIHEFVTGQSTEPFMKVVEREETVTLQLSREMLYGSIYDEVSYKIYEENVHKALNKKTALSEKELRDIYFNQKRGHNIIELARLSSESPVELNYLTSPIRGILSIMLVLAALASAMYFLTDQEQGKFDWLSPKRRLIPAFAICISATILAGLAILMALFFSGLSEGALRELLSMCCFIISATGFSLIFCVVFKSFGKLGACIPGIIILTLVLSPIFFNVTFLKPVRLMLPTHYYLYSLYDNMYYTYGIIYSVLTYLTAVCLNTFIHRKN